MKYIPVGLSQNSIESDALNLTKGHYPPLKKKIVDYLSLHPSKSFSSRQLAISTWIDRSTITRQLIDLQHLNRIEIAKKDKCMITGRKVNHYKIISPQSKSSD